MKRRNIPGSRLKPVFVREWDSICQTGYSGPAMRSMPWRRTRRNDTAGTRGLIRITPEVADTSSLVTMTQQALAGGARWFNTVTRQRVPRCDWSRHIHLHIFAENSAYPLSSTIISILPLRSVRMVYMWTGRRVRRRSATQAGEAGKLLEFLATTGWSLPSKPSVKVRIMSHSALFLILPPNQMRQPPPWICWTMQGENCMLLWWLSEALLRIMLGADKPGANAVAVSSALFAARNIRSAAEKFSRLFKQTSYSFPHKHGLSNDLT